MNDYNDLIPALLNPQCPLKFMLDNLVTVHGYAFVKVVHPSKNLYRILEHLFKYLFYLHHIPIVMDTKYTTQLKISPTGQ